MKDFFISYNSADEVWAKWIATELEAAGYSTVIQAWDFLPGGNIPLQMHDAASKAKQTLAVLSPNYLSSKFTAPEWAAAFMQDPTGEQRRLIPIRVERVNLSGLLAPIIYIDLVDVDEDSARNRLLTGVDPNPRPRIATAKPPFKP